MTDCSLLASRGHTFSVVEFKESIMVYSSSKIVIHSGDVSVVVSASIFPSVELVTRDDLMSQSGDARCYVRCNPLVILSIRTKFSPVQLSFYATEACYCLVAI